MLGLACASFGGRVFASGRSGRAHASIAFRSADCPPRANGSGLAGGGAEAAQKKNRDFAGDAARLRMKPVRGTATDGRFLGSAGSAAIGKTNVTGNSASTGDNDVRGTFTSAGSPIKDVRSARMSRRREQGRSSPSS